MVVVNSGGMDIYIDGILKKNLDFIKEKVLNRKMDFVICADGRVGQGKSTFASQLAKILDPTFNLSRVVFTPQQFIDAVKQAKRGEAIQFDEAMVVSSRSALSEYNKAVVQMMAQVRSKQLFIIFCLPSIFDLDRNLALHRVNLLLHCYSQEFGSRGRFTAYFEDGVKTLYLRGKKFYSYSHKPNFYGRFTKKFTLDEDEYEKKKQDALQDLGKKPITDTHKRWLRQRNRLICWIYKNANKSSTKIADMTGELERREVSRVIAAGEGQNYPDSDLKL